MATGDRGSKGRRRAAQARPVSEIAGKVLEPVIARRAGMNLDLVAAWADIVGPPHGDYTRPEKINWPRRAHEEDPFEPGTRVVACDGARAVLFQHEADQCVERVNAFFGFRAIARIRIVQKPVTRRAAPARRGEPDPGPEARARISAIVDRIEDEELRKRLEKLGRGVFATRRS
ncbi:MAG: DciA family protein [Pseudomonadota bacterium]|nr:DciA family protein [Pseudomonadota bacterium]